MKWSPSTGKAQAALLFLTLLACSLFIILDVYPLRQIVGFFVFTFAPSWLILSLARADKLDFWTKVALSLGLSMAYLMFLGALANWLYFALGYDAPLSVASLLPTFVAGLVILGALAWWRNGRAFSFRLPSLNMVLEEQLLLVSLLFPIFAVLSAEVMNRSSNNSLALVVYFAMAAYTVALGLLWPRTNYVYATAA